MEEGKIRSKLDLMIRLIDAPTGTPVNEKNIRFFRDDSQLMAHDRGEGCYIFINTGRENSLMQVEVYGYEPRKVELDYEKLDELLPAVDVFLIPSENHRQKDILLTLRGQLSGLEAVEALHPGRPVTGIMEYDARKKIITVFSPNRRVNLTREYYGIVQKETGTFIDIKVNGEMTGKKVKLQNAIEGEFAPNAPVCPIVFGQVEADGTYMLCVRDDGENLNYLIKYVVNGDIRYKKIDFHHLDEAKLD